MKLGAERNKVILLIVLSIIAVVVIYVQYFGSAPAVPRPPQPAATVQPPQQRVIQRQARSQPARSSGQGFGASFSSDSDEPLDPMKIDPTLRTEELTKVRSVEFNGVERNLFQFTTRKVEAPSPDMVSKAQELLKQAEAAKPTPPPEPPKPAKPTAPPIQWKFYGFANKPDDPRKRAFLLDSEGLVFVATEGDVFSQRYRIVRIGLNSIVVEDMQFEAEQSLPLEEQGRG